MNKFQRSFIDKYTLAYAQLKVTPKFEILPYKPPNYTDFYYAYIGDAGFPLYDGRAYTSTATLQIALRSFPINEEGRIFLDEFLEDKLAWYILLYNNKKLVFKLYGGE